MGIAGPQRFTRQHPCPICGGYDALERGRGIRCFGFLSDDGAWAHCTREDRAGPLDPHPTSLTYAHILRGECRCGLPHGTQQALPAPSPGRSRYGRSAAPIAGTVDRSYVYTDPAGRPLHRTVRFRNPKSFRQQRYEQGIWRWGLAGIQPVLYRLPELLAADPQVPVFLPEGEKDVDRLAALGLIATTNPMGAKGWRSHFGQWLRGRRVVILEDNDDEGRARTETLRSALEVGARSLHVVRFTDMPAGSDVSDWLDGGGTAQHLLERVTAEIEKSCNDVTPCSEANAGAKNHGDEALHDRYIALHHVTPTPAGTPA